MAAKILLSFPMKNHGARFAHWLRNELMKHYGLADVDDVYMDRVVASMKGSQKLENTLSRTFAKPGRLDSFKFWEKNKAPVAGNAAGNKREKGVTYVMPDMRDAKFSEGKDDRPGNQIDSINIGAEWLDWDKNFLKGMKQAKVVIFCYDKEFLESKWCRQEWAQYLKEAARRPSLKGVGIDFGRGSQFFTNQPRGFTRIDMTKQVIKEFGTNIFAWEPGDYTLNLSDFMALTRAIGEIR